ncbi:MAG: dephospho-CoA kinase [Bdellovibrionales bacterium RBG_16_40_8]|nr:MAG: dephospho-CoA kinase [Bdellovibrionales bacterium RBG_16_40_8]
MKWVGLTGGIATGKSTVAKLIRDLGLPVVDADHLAREVTKPGSVGLKKIVEEFGLSVLTPRGELDREKLGVEIFNNEQKRLRLENILHPLIRELRAVERRNLEKQGCELAFYDVPLLFEKNMDDEFDATILVYASQSEQRSRLRDRNGMAEEQIEARLRAQLSIDEKLKRADYVILNNGSLTQLKLNVQTVIGELSSS